MRATAPEAEAARLEAMLEFERGAAAQGFRCIAGVDEAGRGPLAGPIVAAACILAAPVAGLNDSKLLDEARREALYAELTGGAHRFGLCEIAPAEIDRHGIQPANYRAMAGALAQLDPPPDCALVDGFNVPGLPMHQVRIVKGDRRSLSIAAASIIAKVHRDRVMAALDALYPAYGFARHKGYGTAEHLAALAAHGPCPVHRMSFAPIAARPGAGLLL